MTHKTKAGSPPGCAEKSIANTQPTAKERYEGCLVGLAVGDAVGTTVEFMPPGSFIPVEDMTGGGPFSLTAGEWTDDTSMALCLAASLTECQGFNAHDQMLRYCSWYRDGYMSSTGSCFDIGNTVRAALQVFESSGRVFAGSQDPQTAGNGSLMRLAPVPMAYAYDPTKAIEFSGLSSSTTHGARVAIDACRYFAALLVGALKGACKDELTAASYSPVPGHWEKYPLCEEIELIARGSFKNKKPPAIRGTGYAAHSLESVLWAFHNSEDFKSGCLLAVNLGDDADTTSAIFGQLAGAFYGVGAIPEIWRNKIVKLDLISDLSGQLLKLSQNKPQTIFPTTNATDFAQKVLAHQQKWRSDSTEVIAATEAISALPASVALARANDVTHVMALTFGSSSYTRPSGPEGIHPSECRPEWLHEGSAASVVYAYCLAAGLKPHIVMKSSDQQQGRRFPKRSFIIYAGC